MHVKTPCKRCGLPMWYSDKSGASSKGTLNLGGGGSWLTTVARQGGSNREPLTGRASCREFLLWHEQIGRMRTLILSVFRARVRSWGPRVFARSCVSSTALMLVSSTCLPHQCAGRCKPHSAPLGGILDTLWIACLPCAHAQTVGGAAGATDMAAERHAS